MLACETCRQLGYWGSPNGPDGLGQRIAVMLDLAADGSFEELHPRYIDGYYRDCVPWLSANRGSLRTLVPDGHGPGRGLPEVAPFIGLRCGSC